MARRPDPKIARCWQQRIDRFDDSPLTIAEFCQREGVSTASFYHWRRKLREPKFPPQSAFVPVALEVGEPSPRSATSAAEIPGCEIDLPGGASVRLPYGATRTERRELITDIILATSGRTQT